jgi:conjugal transfer pilus assembly protein TraU
VVILALAVCSCHALCKARFLNPITEVGWANLFPLKIGGITVVDSDQPDTREGSPNPICVCTKNGRIRIGINVSFWEPYRIVDSVFDPGCFPALGLDLKGIIDAGKRVGGVTHVGLRFVSSQYFAQSHFVISPFMVILKELFKDVGCLDNHTDLDIAYMSELDPTWNDDQMSFLLNPEAILFANPALGMACMADAAKTMHGLPIDSLFWCMGSWDSAYPLTGTSTQNTIISGACAIAARMIYKMNRELLMEDRALDACEGVLTPIWIKSHYRLQPLRPRVMTSGAIRIGQNPDTWATGRYNPFTRAMVTGASLYGER